jgi:hypothetical protein
MSRLPYGDQKAFLEFVCHVLIETLSMGFFAGMLTGGLTAIVVYVFTRVSIH